MKIAFWNNRGEKCLAGRIYGSVKRSARGETIYNLHPEHDFRGVPEGDLGIICGIKSSHNQVLDTYKKNGVPIIYVDNGYFKYTVNSPIIKYYRLGIGCFHNSEFVYKAKCTNNRFREFRRHYEIRPFPKRGGAIGIAAASPKFHKGHRLPSPNDYAQMIIDEVRKYSDRPIIYRPKPVLASRREPVTIKGVRISHANEPLPEFLQKLSVLICHSTNAHLEALRRFIPVITLGPSISSCYVSKSISEVESPIPVERSWLTKFHHNTAFCQWTHLELRNPHVWKYIRYRVDREHGRIKKQAQDWKEAEAKGQYYANIHWMGSSFPGTSSCLGVQHASTHEIAAGH